MKLVRETQNQSHSDWDYLNSLNEYWVENPDNVVEKLEAFTNFVSRQSLTKFLARNEIFQKQVDVHGSIVEVGVHRGTSFMTWAHLSSIYEPVNYLRKIIGFDTFSGFNKISEKDASGKSEHLKQNGFDAGEHSYQQLHKAIELYDKNRLMNHIKKCDLIKGDAVKTIPSFIEKNPETLVSLLHLDSDLYEPTFSALEYFLPRMPKGSVILFDELNMEQFPGETLAMLEHFELNSCRLQRFSYSTSMSYMIIGS